MKVYMLPNYNNPDSGDGGIRRVVEAQRKYLPEYNWNFVDNINDCDVAAFHAGLWENPPAGTPVVCHNHGLYWADYTWPRWAESVNKDLVRTIVNADAVTAVSEWTANAIRRAFWVDPVIVNHGINPEEWTPGENHGYVLWNKTRPDPVCDPSPVSELARRATDVRFVTTFTDGNANSGNVVVTGRLSFDQAKRYIQNAGVYLATPQETFGIGTLEAMACEVPVLGWAWGGQLDIIEHKKTGYLAKVGDYNDLERGLDYVLNNREALGRAAREHVLKNFTWRKFIRQYAELYDKLVINRLNKPKVSIVIPHYNLGAYLPHAIRTARDSTKYSKEIIVVDDASREPLPDLPSDVVLVKNQTNQYLSGTLNNGIAAARGEYVLPLDADNMLARGSLDPLIESLDADRTLAIAYGKLSIIEPDGREWTSQWPPEAASVEDQLAHKNQISSTALYRKAVWSRVGGYRRRCRTAEDADFWTRALVLGFTGRRVSEGVVLRYRNRSDSMSHVNKDWPWQNWYSWGYGAHKSAAIGGPVYINDNPRVSIIIPVGPKHEKYLIDAIDSVQSQSSAFPSWECIVVNDTGHDLGDLPPWVRVCEVEGGSESRGVSHARNRGTEAAKGEYILYLDADDYLHPDALYHLYNTHKSSHCPELFVYTDWFVAETGERRLVDEFHWEDIYVKIPYPVSCLYKKSDLKKHNIKWDESFTTGWEDWDYGIQVVTAGICGVRIAAPLLHYRLNSGSLRTTAYSNGDDIKARVRDKWLDKRRSDMPGCGGCGGGQYPSIMANITQTGIFDGVNLDTETTLLQYNPPEEWAGSSARTFIGRGTGNRYRFSTNAENRVRRVYNLDLKSLLDIGCFVVVGGPGSTTTPLQADGPPLAASAEGGGDVGAVGVEVNTA